MNKKYYKFEMNMKTLNIVCIILFIIIVLPCFIFYSMDETSLILSMMLMIPYFILHEILHSISYVIHGADFKYVSYGMHLEKGIFCCLCKQNISKKNIMFSLMYPFFFIGIVTMIVGIIFNIPVLIYLSAFNISGCAGDLVMFFDFLKLKDIEYTEADDPTSFCIYTKEDLSDKKLFGLINKGEFKDISRTIGKKVEISKSSIIILIVLAIMYALNLVF